MTGRVLISALLLVIIIEASHSASLPGTSLPDTDTSEVALVNGEVVIKREFMLQARFLKPLVISAFRSRYGVEYNHEFWLQRYDGRTPANELKSRTIDTLIRIKVQQICAQRAGVIADISYRGFLKALEAENTRRLSAKQSGKVIYGPVQYTEDVYYSYLFSNMVAGLKELLSVSKFRISERQIMESYDNEKDSMFKRGYYTEIILMRLNADSGNGNQDIVKSSRDSQTTMIFNDSVYSPEEEEALRSLAKEAARKLSKGECSKALEFRGTAYMVKVTEKRQLGYRSYESSKTAVRTLLINRMYDEYIQNLVKEAKVEINFAEYQSIQF